MCLRGRAGADYGTDQVILSDDERAAIEWSIATTDDPSIQTVENWLRNRLRGELIAVTQAHRVRLDAEIVRQVRTSPVVQVQAIITAASEAVEQNADSAMSDQAVVDALAARV